jgi:hypothetical protein
MIRILNLAAGLTALVVVSVNALWSQEASSPAARTDVWTIHQPYADNPLRQAAVAGSLTAAGTSRPAELQIECRAPELALLNLFFRSTDLKFDLNPFEGPPGVGQKRKLLAIELDGHLPPPAYFFSGAYVEADRFVFSLAPSRTDMRNFVSMGAARKKIRIQVSPAEGKGSPLMFIFTVPADNAPVLDVANPCLESKEPKR